MSIKSKFAGLKARTHNNEIEILHSKTCSCIFCRQQYDARKVNDWVNDENGMSAICPECGMDTVIGDSGGEPLDKETLKALNLAFYGEDYMIKHPEAAKKYVKRYQERKITHKKANECLYIQYLSLLSSLGDAEATYSLGQLYEFGDEFTEKDPQVAFSYYASNPLKNDGDALTRLGVLSANGSLGKIDASGAYEAFAKGMAMGSLDALIHFSDCYGDGIGTNVDKDFAFTILSSIWEESYQRFTFSVGKDINIFPDLCYRLAGAYENGDGIQKDDGTALRFYLLASFAYSLKEEHHSLTGEDKEIKAFCYKKVKEIAAGFSFSYQDPVFDSSTFASSMLLFGSTPSPLLRMEFSFDTYDEKEHILYFDVKYNLPPLIIDVASLYCGFIGGPIHWAFDNVTSWTVGEKRVFNRVSGDDGSSLSLISDFGEEAGTIATFYFDGDDSSPIKDLNKKKGDTEA